jgi:hypothetical protein
VAVTCIDSKSGCWSDRDLPRLRQVLIQFQGDFFRPTSNATNVMPRLPVIAIGASSGGYMAAKVAAEGLADAALVMVMGLQPNLQQKLVERKPPLYLAPMPRDQRTLKRSQENYQALVKADYNGNQTIETDSSVTTASSSHVRVILDEESCVPLPVTVNYLWERVPGLTKDHATRIILALQNAGHLGKDDQFFRNDPTSSDWRNVLLSLDPPPSTSINIDSKTGGAEKFPKDTLWGLFRLTRGQSPLAKAFHRAWAFHEYCSESVPLALDFFESVLT